MKRHDKQDGGYTLTASAGHDLVALAEDGTEQARTKEVAIPAEGTLNNWQEVPEVITPTKTEDEQKAERIAALEVELAALKGGAS